MSKLPIGVQDFEKLREGGFIYVDKTKSIYDLVASGIPYFLSRPRRFGKSLLLSTMKCYFEGRRDLFDELDIIGLEDNSKEPWVSHPVFYFDFNQDNYTVNGSIENVLDRHLSMWESEYGNPGRAETLAGRFQYLIRKAVEKTGRRAVVLVDEYDKSLLESTRNKDLLEHNRAVFKGFFSTLKSYDHYLKFVFLTGVTKFSKVSIFSDLNHLVDISLDDRYSSICGITEDELEKNFKPEIEDMAAKLGVGQDECLSRLREAYDGYHFSEDSKGVYNPYSLLNALSSKKIRYYWFETGTPTILIEKLKKTGFDPKRFTEGGIRARETQLTDYGAENEDPIPLFYQTGYLTIRGFNPKYRSYTLGYPNNEVKYAMLESLESYFLKEEDGKGPLYIENFCEDLENNDLDSLRDRFVSLFARLPYGQGEDYLERDFQNVIYIVFMLMGQFVQTEVHNAKGRADAVVCTEKNIFIFEFKRDGSALDALQQIETHAYAAPYAADPREIVKVGVNFDSEKRNITEWETVS